MHALFPGLGEGPFTEDQVKAALEKAAKMGRLAITDVEDFTSKLTGEKRQQADGFMAE
jgi:hypothetical protein